MKEEVKFRVSVWFDGGESGGIESSSIHFTSYRKARQVYKSLLLKSFRKKNLKAWRICLNRAKDPSWEEMLFFEGNGSSDLLPEGLPEID